MSRKNEFDIDDILSEIKERKSKEKDREPSPAPLPPLRYQSADTSDSLYRTTFDELDALVEKTSAQDQEWDLETILEQSHKKAQQSPSPSIPPKQQELVFETTPPPPNTFFEEAAQESQVRQPEQPQQFLSRSEQVRETPAKIPAHKVPNSETSSDGAFDYSAFDDIVPISQAGVPAQPPKPSSRQEAQPLNFGGTSRSITDKANARERYADLAKNRAQASPARPPQSRLNFETLKQGQFEPTFENPTEQLAPRVPVVNPTPPEPYLDEKVVRSRSGRYVTPENLTGKSLRIEDIRRMDFESVEGAGTRDREVYYEEDPINQYEDGSYVNLREYRPTSDREDVARSIANTKMVLLIRTGLTGLLGAVLLYFTLSGSKKLGWLPLVRAMFPVPETMGNYLMVCTIVMAFVLVVNVTAIGQSLYNLARMRANSETLPSLAVLAALIQGLYATMNPTLIDPDKMNLYFAAATFTMLFAAIGRLGMLGRIQANFRVVSSKLEKKAVLAVDSSGFAHDIAQDEGTLKPTVAYAAKASFFNDFVGLSFSDRYDVGINRSVAPACLLGALIIGIGARLLAGETLSALSAVTAALTICATLTATFIESIPLNKLAKRLTPYGCMVSGNKAIETFCDSHSVILNDTDLFPAGNISLYDMKAFPDARIADAILDAASVLYELGGVLNPLALDMIGGDSRLLKKVDDLVYENGMGVAAWVNKKRILVGNRALMRNHGVLLPSDSYERENEGTPQGNPVYISNSGEVSARFLVNYNIDEELAYQLDQLGLQGRGLVVYTTDPNINVQMLWDTYGYPLEKISILPPDLHHEYLDMADPHDELPAEIVYTGGAANYIAAILGTVTTRTSILSATLLQLLQILLGYGLIAFLSFLGFIGNVSIIALLAYQLFWLAATLLVQHSRKT